MAIMNTPKTLNGFPVIRVEQHTACSTVIVHIETNAYTPYVVATWFSGNEWLWGHYCRDMVEAIESFNAVATRNTKRAA